MVGVSCHPPGRRFTRVILPRGLRLRPHRTPAPRSAPKRRLGGTVYDRIVPRVPTNQYAKRPACPYRDCLPSQEAARFVDERATDAFRLTPVAICLNFMAIRHFSPFPVR